MPTWVKPESTSKGQLTHDDNRMTITYQRGGHDAAKIGPHLLMVGWERRVGRR
jgi:hypothetical protein